MKTVFSIVVMFCAAILLVFGLHVASAKADAPQAFEYKTIGQTADFVAQLNANGKAGWHVVASYAEAPSGPVVILERPLR